MGVIGGIVCGEGKQINTAALTDMSRAMLVRGNGFRSAYIRNGAGLFSHASVKRAEQGIKQPITLTRKGRTCTAVLEGCPIGNGEMRDVIAESGEEEIAEILLETYFSYGTEFLSYWSGHFALAIWEEERGELLLVRDREGSCPLFYCTDADTVVFSSEIKGLLRYSPEAAMLDRQMLRSYLCAPCGTYTGDRLYCDIQSVPPGFCALWSRMGSTLFPYAQVPTEEATVQSDVAVSGEIVCPDEEELRDILTEAVFAFDYPQFDYLMPSLFQILRQTKGKKHAITVADGALHMDIRYARERADRLGGLYGVSVNSVSPASFSVRQKELKKMDKILDSLLSKVDRRILDHIWQTDWREQMEKEKNLEKRIRIRGLLYQSTVWWEHYRLAMRET